MRRLIQLIGKCHDWRSLYAISEQFLNSGLALCRAQDGIPQHGEIFDDYIFACGLQKTSG